MLKPALTPTLALLLTVGAMGCDGPGKKAEEPQPRPVSTAGPSEEPPEPTPQPEAGLDLSTDDGVRAAYEAATGRALHEDSCIGQTGVENIVVIGDFAHDRGCDVSGGFIKGEFLDGSKLSAQGLARIGWSSLDEAGKLEMAQRWMAKVHFKWGGDVVTEASRAFEFDDTPKFVPPKATVDGDGVVVVAWVEDPPGMQDQDAFQKIEMRISAEGAVTTKSLERFAVEGSRLR